ncbi:MAG: YeiH family protein [Comamonas sp.]
MSRLLRPALLTAPASTPAWPAGAGAAARGRLPGLVLAGAIGLAATLLGQSALFAGHGLSPLVLAIVLGMALGNSVYPRWQAPCDAGVALCKQTLLRAGIVLYGFRLTLQDIGHIGWAGVAADALVLCGTFALALWIGVRVLGLERGTAILIGAGSSICGAAAVLATGPVARARADQVTVAVATVVVFGTLAVGLYPLLYTWTLPCFADAASAQRFFGLYVGSTVHEVAQVVAAGQAIGPEVAQDAVIAKLVRVLMLAPFLVVLSAVLAHAGRRARPAVGNGQRHDAGAAGSITIPWFALAFMGVVALHSAVALPPALDQALRQVDTLLLSSAMAALGLTTHHSAIRRAGLRPLLLAGLLFVWLLAGGAGLNAAALGLLG